MGLSVKIIDYAVEGDEQTPHSVVRMSFECRYKEFKRVIASKTIVKEDKLIHELQQECLESCKLEIQEWVNECDTQSVIGQFIPVPADFLE